MATATVSTKRTFVQRLVGASMLNAATYEELEADPRATTQALVVVLLSSVSAGLGARGLGAHGFSTIGFFAVLALMAWVAWSVVIYQVGVRLLPAADTRADVGELLRTIGFATAPGILRVFGVVPGLTTPVLVITALWMLAAMIVAVRQALDYASTRRAVMVCILGWLFAIAFVFIFGALFTTRLS
jgi:hypothetical protein